MNKKSGIGIGIGIAVAIAIGIVVVAFSAPSETNEPLVEEPTPVVTELEPTPEGKNFSIKLSENVGITTP